MSYWEKQGRIAARVSPTGWRDLADGVYRQACADRDIKIKELEYEGALLKEEERELGEELKATSSRPFHVALISLIEGLLWGVLSVFLIRAGYALLLLTLPLLSKLEEARHLLAAVLAVSAAVAFELWFRWQSKVLPEAIVRKWMLFIALTPVLLLLAAAFTASLIRGEFTAAQGALEMVETPAVTIEASSTEAISGAFQGIVQSYYSRSGKLGSILMFVATGGIELTAALALHEALGRVLTSMLHLFVPLRLRRVRRRMVACAKDIAERKGRPEIIKEEFIRGAMLELGKLQKGEGDNVIELSQEKSLSIWVLLFIGFFIAVFFLALSQVYAREMVVVAPDLSASSSGEEMAKNFRTVEEIIFRLKPGSRFVVMPITDQSFSRDSIIDAYLTADEGLFAERVKNGRQQLIQMWRKRTQHIKANYNRTDLFGAFGKISVLVQESPGFKPLLVCLSDMRQVGRGFNFERTPSIDLSLIGKVEKHGLIPRLKGARVWVLGVHAQGVSELYWMSLKSFWSEYFGRAEAEVVIFSPNRRWSYE